MLKDDSRYTLHAKVPTGPLPGDFDDVAFFVYRFPVGIGFGSLKLNGLVANGTNREPYPGRDAHNVVQLRRRRLRAKR
jgi:hypothetical protein